MFELIVRPAVIAHRKEQHRLGDIAWDAKYEDLGPRLHISELGGCPRAAYLRMLGYEPKPWDDYTIEVMNSGNVWEAENEEALQWYYDQFFEADKGIITQSLLGNDIWAGSDDYELCNIDGVNYVIEHKSTSDANFRYGNRLPYNFHVYQVLGYAHFLEQSGGEKWQSRLYYHGRGNWAEFDVWEVMNTIQYEGQLNGKPVVGSLDTTLDNEMSKLAVYWPDSLPPVYPTPMDFDITFGCTKARGRKGHKIHWPSCRWWSSCYDLPYDQPVEP